MPDCGNLGRIAVDARNIVKNYGKKRVLNGLTFKVESGTIWALLGPNGSGKTTTLRILAGLLGWDSGSLSIFGKQIAPGKYPHGIRRLVSYLPEEAGLYERLTGWENLYFFAMIYTSSNKEAEEMAEYGVKLSGLGKDVHMRAGEYSKGMKRRLLLARTLMVRPCLAVLDEPTSGLDVFSSLSIRKTIRDYAAKSNSTIILSSHNMLEVQYLSDEVAFLYKGVIIEKGKPGELLSKYSVQNLEDVYASVVSSKQGAAEVHHS